MFGDDLAELWLDRLKQAGLVLAFVKALQARSVTFDEKALSDPDSVIPDEELEAFMPRARAFRCQVLVNGNIKGSGVLVGPSLVLTSWHVISGRCAREAPGARANL